MKQIVVTLMLLAAAITAAWGAEIGSWNCYLAYSNITEIQPAGKIVYVLSSKGLYAYNTADNSIQNYDKINALSDCKIAHIAYCKAAKRLVISYENQNIDLLDDNVYGGKILINPINNDIYYIKNYDIENKCGELYKSSNYKNKFLASEVSDIVDIYNHKSLEELFFNNKKDSIVK